MKRILDMSNDDVKLFLLKNKSYTINQYDRHLLEQKNSMERIKLPCYFNRK